MQSSVKGNLEFQYFHNWHTEFSICISASKDSLCNNILYIVSEVGKDLRIAHYPYGIRYHPHKIIR